MSWYSKLVCCLFVSMISFVSCRTQKQCVIDDIQRATIFSTDSFHFVVRPINIPFAPSIQVTDVSDKSKELKAAMPKQSQDKSIPSTTAFEVTGTRTHLENILKTESQKNIQDNKPLSSTCITISHAVPILLVFLSILLVFLFIIVIIKVTRL